jgi:hypothetical protein
MMRRLSGSGLVTSAAAGIAVLALWAGVEQHWPVAARLPLAMLVFLILPGHAISRTMRLRAEPPVTAAVAVALSLSLDLLAAELLVVLRVATVSWLLAVLGGVCAMTLVANLRRSTA